MPSKQGPRFIATKTMVHVVGAGVECPQVKKAARTGAWKGRRGISPDAALALKACTKCKTHERAKDLLGRDDDAAADRAAATRDHVSGKTTWYLGTDGGWGTNPEFAARDDEGNILKSRTMPTSKGKPKSKQAPDLASGRRGRKPTGGGSQRKRSKADNGSKAEGLVAFAKEHDWDASIEELDGTELRVVATRDDLTIECFFVDGNYNRDRFSYVHKGDWSGRLRGVHGCKKQMAGNNAPHPEPGRGKSASRPKARTSPDAESDDDFDDDEDSGGVPWLADDEDYVIIDHVRGRVIEWRNSKSGKLMKAEVPPNGKRTVIYDHPKAPNRRILQFDEVVYDEHRRAELGGLRDVALDRIVRIT